MKRFICLLLALMMVLSLAACAQPAQTPPAEEPPAEEQPAEEPPAEEPPAEEEPFEGIIAIVTNTLSQNEEEYRSAELMVKTYGEDKLVSMVKELRSATTVTFETACKKTQLLQISIL